MKTFEYKAMGVLEQIPNIPAASGTDAISFKVDRVFVGNLDEPNFERFLKYAVQIKCESCGQLQKNKRVILTIKLEVEE